MTATQKIEGLINSWYGYALFGAAVSLWENGLGLWSLFSTAGGLFLSFLVTWFIGNRLKNRSSLWRLVLVIGSAVACLFGSISVARMGVSLFHSFSLSTLFAAGLVTIGVWMNGKSYRVLTDSSVKAYFNAG
ncbi:MAG: hypothetical protein JWP97_1254 [Labilithrix sp.]|nr:hypothetical protein [Labilithrix sp.]